MESSPFLETMAKMTNTNNNIFFEITPVLDSNKILYEEDFKNWIAFSIIVKTMTEKIGYFEKNGAMISVLEVKNILNGLKNILSSEKFFEYYSIERYFDLYIEKCKYELDMYEAEVWFNMGTYTNGKEYGYDKGIKFYINKGILQDFYNSLYNETVITFNLNME